MSTPIFTPIFTQKRPVETMAGRQILASTKAVKWVSPSGLQNLYTNDVFGANAGSNLIAGGGVRVITPEGEILGDAFAASTVTGELERYETYTRPNGTMGCKTEGRNFKTYTDKRDFDLIYRGNNRAFAKVRWR